MSIEPKSCGGCQKETYSPTLAGLCKEHRQKYDDYRKLFDEKFSQNAFKSLNPWTDLHDQLLEVLRDPNATSHQVRVLCVLFETNSSVSFQNVHKYKNIHMFSMSDDLSNLLHDVDARMFEFMKGPCNAVGFTCHEQACFCELFLKTDELWLSMCTWDSKRDKSMQIVLSFCAQLRLLLNNCVLSESKKLLHMRVMMGVSNQEEQEEQVETALQVPQANIETGETSPLVPSGLIGATGCTVTNGGISNGARGPTGSAPGLTRPSEIQGSAGFLLTGQMGLTGPTGPCEDGRDTTAVSDKLIVPDEAKVTQDIDTKSERTEHIKVISIKEQCTVCIADEAKKAEVTGSNEKQKMKIENVDQLCQHHKYVYGAFIASFELHFAKMAHPCLYVCEELQQKIKAYRFHSSFLPSLMEMCAKFPLTNSFGLVTFQNIRENYLVNMPGLPEPLIDCLSSSRKGIKELMKKTVAADPETKSCMEAMHLHIEEYVDLYVKSLSFEKFLQKLDVIRTASYNAACKLRKEIFQRCKQHLTTQNWNMCQQSMDNAALVCLVDIISLVCENTTK